jgi:D-alanine-D-alanine ligase
MSNSHVRGVFTTERILFMSTDSSLTTPDPNLAQPKLGSPKPTVALVFDSPNAFLNSPHDSFPLDANAEWESVATLKALRSAWEANGFLCIPVPLDFHFPQTWSSLHKTLDLVHSVVEGWGSVSREGWIPALCELSGVPFVGSTSASQSLTLNKHLTKLVAQSVGVPVAKGGLVTSSSELHVLSQSDASWPLFLKPNFEGSGMGITAQLSRCTDADSLMQNGLTLLQTFPEGVLVEEDLPGLECTTAIVGAEEIFLPVAQIDVDGGVYGIEWKGKDARGEKVTFPLLPPTEQHFLEVKSRLLFRALQLSDMARMDWKKNNKGEWNLLEVNALPGLSPIYSVLPLMAQHANISFQQLIQMVGESALRRTGDRALRYGRHLRSFAHQEF